MYVHIHKAKHSNIIIIIIIIIIFILLQVGCNPVAVVMLHVYKHENGSY
jgi:flagellar basal body-associated protein FliL